MQVNKYPRATKFLQVTGMSIDEALKYFEEKVREENGEQQ
jgi:hypothetical protein